MVSILYRRASMVYLVVYIEYKSSSGVVRWFTCNTKVAQSWCSSDGRCFEQTLDRQVSVNQSQQGGTVLAIHSTGDHKTQCVTMLRKHSKVYITLRTVRATTFSWLMGEGGPSPKI